MSLNARRTHAPRPPLYTYADDLSPTDMLIPGVGGGGGDGATRRRTSGGVGAGAEENNANRRIKSIERQPEGGSPPSPSSQSSVNTRAFPPTFTTPAG